MPAPMPSRDNLRRPGPKPRRCCGSTPVSQLNASVIAWLKANPDKASAGTAGVGSPQHVSGLLFQNVTTPKNVIGRLNSVVVEALTVAKVRASLAEQGMEIFPREQQTPEALGRFHKAEIEKWWPIIKAANIKGSEVFMALRVIRGGSPASASAKG